MKRSALFMVLALVTFTLTPGLPGAAQSLTSWPQFGASHEHHSYNPDTAITTGNVSRLGINWMANLFSPDLGSPVVGFNAKLNANVVYVGNERGDVFAVNAANGKLLWSTNLGVGDAIRATPAIASDGALWVGTVYNPTLYKLDGATGAVDCSFKSTSYIDGSIMIATPAGGSELVYFDTNNNHVGPGPLYAVSESSCAKVWAFSKYVSPAASSWTTPAFAVDSKGRSLIIIGSTDPDQHAYAVDALMGTLVWSYFPIVGPGPWDLGASADISPPGKNGFADGVAYMQSKYGVEYALNLTNGVPTWQYNMTFNSGTRDARSAAALDGNNLVFGYQDGVDALNAKTGSLLWEYNTPLEVVSGPAIVGPAGSEVVAFGDISGAFRVLGLSSGAQLYSYQTGGYIASSPAELNGHFYIPSSDGFLYSYDVGGSSLAPPATKITSPANLSQLRNPNGNLPVAGSSTDGKSVSAVEISIQSNGASGPWYDAATNSWVSAPVRNPATLAKPGAPSTTWSFSMPAPAGGGTYQLFANTVNGGNVVDPGTNSSFTIDPSTTEPTLTVSSAFVQPGATVELSGNAFADGEKVQISFLGTVVATDIASKTGSVPSTKITVPGDAAFGPTSVTATGLTSGKSASITVGVTNNWTQFGYGATRTSFEPHDSALVQVLDIGSGTVLKKSWAYATGAAVNTSPTVVDGVIYVGNDGGTITAVATNTGAPKWTYTTPSRSPIHSSPAVDPSGNILFGANDGKLYVLNPSGGHANTVSLGGKLGSPAVDNGQIYIGSDNGTLYDLADPAATVTWTAQMPAAIHSSPTYDAGNNIVIVGDDAGNITALNSVSGAQLWRVKTGGPITASAAIQGGVVWIGSNDGTMYVLKETTGALQWKAAADSAILATADVNGTGNVSFGSQKGTLYLYTPSGQETFAQPNVYGNSPIVGVGAITNNYFVETAGGQIAGTRLDAGAAQAPFFKFYTGSSLTSAPTILDSALYVGAGDGNLYAFTPYGKSPVPASVQRASPGPIITVTNQQWSCTPQ